jgi:hypothetical protein
MDDAGSAVRVRVDRQTGIEMGEGWEEDEQRRTGIRPGLAVVVTAA